MKRKKSTRKNPKLINIHMYGIFDFNKKTITKVSLDKTEIQMEIAL